ncbi:hypothetical protein PG999_008655 [Apiospora kogelbergensis]|uniref:Uncharacterized protein n=1 Tax=Apiospora kogelbergensis TaxID=1337665 RepID=A0AAW0QJE7_9PEZI
MENHNLQEPKRAREDVTGSKDKGHDVEAPAPKRLKVESPSTAEEMNRGSNGSRLSSTPRRRNVATRAPRIIPPKGGRKSRAKSLSSASSRADELTRIDTSNFTEDVKPAKKESSETLVDFQLPLEKRRSGETMKDFLERQKKYYKVNGLGKNKTKTTKFQTSDTNDTKIKDEDCSDEKNDTKIKDEDSYDDEEGIQQSNNQPDPSSRKRRRHRFNVKKLRRTNRDRDRQTDIEFPAELHEILRESQGIVGNNDVYLVVIEQNRRFAFFHVLATTQRKDVANQLALSLFRTEVAQVLPELRKSPGLDHEQERKSLAQLADGVQEPHEWTKAIWYRAVGDIRGDARLSWYVEREGYSAGLVTLNAALPGTPYQVTVKVLRNDMVL